MKKHFAIAIDGPAASGKSTAAKGVADILNFLYVDTGAMYRAFTYFMLSSSLDPKSEEDALFLLPKLHLREDKEGRIYLNGVDVSKECRSKEVTSLVSYACAYEKVREKLVLLQREMARENDVVMDGRDIGTVVLPDADLKIFQVASVGARAYRRHKEYQEKGVPSSLDEIQEDLIRRDHIDSHRDISPLCQASDAILLDTSNMSIEEEIKAIVELFYRKVGERWKYTEKSH